MAKQQQSITVEGSPRIALDVAGDMKLSGWDESVVLVEADEEASIELEQVEGTVTGRCDGDCSVRVPRDSAVRFTVHGDAVVKGLAGELTATQVHGDLVVRHLGRAEIGTVSGDLAVRGVSGDLIVDTVAGDAAIEGVGGSVRAGSVAADLALRDVAGGVEVVCGADAALRLSPQPGHTYAVTAGADLACRVAADRPAEYVLLSGSGAVVVRLPGAKAEDGPAGSRRIVVGEGGPTVTLRAGADLALAGEAADGAPGEVDVEIEMEALDVDMNQLAGEIEATMAAAMGQVTSSLRGAGLADEEAERVAERVRRSQDRAMRHAQHKMEHAQRRAERHARRAERQARRAERHAAGRHEGRRHAWTWRWQSGGEGRGPAQSVPSAATAEQRLTVLKMLSENRISADEAGRLLAALEGS